MHNARPHKGKRGETPTSFTFSSAGRITSVDPKLCHRLKKTPKELLRNTLSSLMTKYSAGITMLLAKRVMDLGKSRRFEISLLTQDNEMLPAMLYLDRQREDGETFLRGSVSFSPDPDILQDQAVQTERMAAMGILATGLAHDISIRTSDLRGYIPKLSKAFDDILPILEETYKSNENLEIAKLSYAAFKKELQKIMAGLKSGTERIAKTVDYFHGLSLDNQKPSREAIDLGQVLRTCVQLTRSLREDRDIDLGLTVNDGVSGIRGDKAQLQYIFLNILFKAHAFLGGNPGKISVTASRSPSTGYTRIEIETTPVEQNDWKHSPRADETALSLNFGLGSIQKLLLPFNGRFGMKSIHEGGMVFQIEIPAPMPVQKKSVKGPIAVEMS